MKLLPDSILLLAATFLLASSSSAHPSRLISTSSWQPNPIKWTSCRDEVPQNVACANMTVPLDWANPHGETIRLALRRLQADTNSSENLLFNPGGPGASVTGVISSAANSSKSAFSELLKKYNIIGVDPRGTGLSTPLICNVDLYNKRVSRFPKTEDEFNTLVEHNKAIGESCLKLSGNLLKHVDTASVARDHEAVRQALGDDKLNLLSFSYGTQLATQYAELFPKSVGRFVLDAVLDHSGSEMYTLVTSASSAETEFDRFAAWCGNSKECALHGKDVTVEFDGVVQKADKTPIPAFGNKTSYRQDVTGEEIRFDMTQFFYPRGGEGWTEAGQALAEALKGNATLLSQPLLGPEDYIEFNVFANRAMLCSNWHRSSPNFSDILYKQKLAASIAPHMRGSSIFYVIQMDCIGWPVPMNNPPHRARIEGATPMLMVNSLHDIAKSYVWAENLREQVPGSVLLTRKGMGHTSFAMDGEATDMINAFLLHGTLPAENTVVDS